MSLLPSEYDSLDFVARRGVPQTVSYTVRSRTISLTLVGGLGDLPALARADATLALVDAEAEAAARPTSIVESPRELLRLAAPASVSSEAARVALLAREGTRLLGVAPVRAGVPLTFGLSEASGLVLEVYFASLELYAGSFVRPGDIGAEIVAGARSRLEGVDRFLVEPTIQESVYDLLA